MKSNFTATGFIKKRMAVTVLSIMLAVTTLSLYADEPTTNETSSVYRSFTSEPLFDFFSRDRFSLEPSYFITGVPNAKFQLGFLYQFSKSLDLFMGYSQLIVWDLGRFQAPMRDINCHPYFYYTFVLNYGMIHSVDLGIWEHNSNLRGGEPVHRGWDRSYIKINTFTSFGKFGLMANLKFFTLYRLDRNNRGIDNHMGFWELNIILAYYDDLYLFDKIEFTAKIFAGSPYGYLLDQGGQEIGISFKFSGNPAHIYFQFYNGYNEWLLEYNHRHTAFRYGFLFYI